MEVCVCLVFKSRMVHKSRTELRGGRIEHCSFRTHGLNGVYHFKCHKRCLLCVDVRRSMESRRYTVRVSDCFDLDSEKEKDLFLELFYSKRDEK